MTEFILGIPKTERIEKKNIARYDNVQNAQNAAHHAVGVWEKNLDTARDKFWDLCLRDFKP